MWNYDKPETSGMYYANYGDVVTEDALSIIKLTFRNGWLCDEDLNCIKNYNDSIKFMPIDFDWFNEVGNK